MSFHHKILQDLHWLLTSPSISASDGLDEILSSEVSMIAQLSEKDCELLLTKRQNLGSYFEDLVALWLKHSKRFELLHRNIQIFKNKQTIGEIDFIIRDRNNNTNYQLEVALKFFLYHNGQFPGLNPSDSLEKKLNKIQQHQLQLPNTPEGKKQLEKIGITSVSPLYFVKGYIFYPEDCQPCYQLAINKEHTKGSWIYEDKLAHFPFELRKVTRINWLSPPFSLQITDSEVVENETSLHPQEKAAMFHIVNRNERTPSKLIVVKNNWPERNN